MSRNICLRLCVCMKMIVMDYKSDRMVVVSVLCVCMKMIGMDRVIAWWSLVCCVYV